MRMKSIKYRDDFPQWVGHNITQVEYPYFSIRAIYGTFLLFLKNPSASMTYRGQLSYSIQSMFVVYRSCNAG